MPMSEMERRRAPRVPVGFYLSQLVDDEPHRCFTTSLSTSGLYMERVLAPLERTRETVQVEIPLPGTGQALWTRAQVVYDRFGSLFHGTAIRFTAMAHRHRRVLADWLQLQVQASPGQIVVAAPGISIHRPIRVRR